MEKINNELRKLCASLEGRVAARLDGEYVEYHRLLDRRKELSAGDELHEVEAELARMRLLVYNARLVELNLLRQQIADVSLAAADEWTKRSGMVTDQEHTRHRGPVEVDVHSEAELEALQLSPHIRQAVTLEALQQIIRFYKQVDAGHIVVRIYDVRAGKPGITWRWPEEKPEGQ